MAVQEVPFAGFRTKLLGRSSVAEGTMAFHFARSSGFSFKAGQAADLTLLNPLETDSEGNIRTASIASPPFEDQLTFATRMLDTAFKFPCSAPWPSGTVRSQSPGTYSPGRKTCLATPAVTTG